MLSELEGTLPPSKLPQIEPESKPPSNKAVKQSLLTVDEPKSSDRALQRIRKETHIMTEKRLKGLEKARAAKRAKKEARQSINVQKTSDFERLSQTVVHLQKRLDSYQQIPRESRANVEGDALPSTVDLIEQGQTVSPIRRAGFSNIASTSISF